MMPEALLKLGLTDAIQDFCDGINDSKIVQIKFSFLGEPLITDQNTNIILYRIVQELCNNAIKHAGGKNIFVQLNHHEMGITLTVEDDGIGMEIPLSEKNTGTGLQNIQSRVNYLKGTISIESTKNEGSSITIEIPLTKSPLHYKAQ